MADDTGAFRAVPDTQTIQPRHMRGPLRPQQLKPVRARVSGAGLARLFQAGDALALFAASLAAKPFFRGPDARCAPRHHD